MTMNETSTFIKKMASPDEKTRDRAVKAVEKFLMLQGNSMGYEEFMKLWKGFFYCFWLSDKSDGQNKLAESISKFVKTLSTEHETNAAESPAFLFLRTFWETMGREWLNLDRLRLNKYYYFMGRVLFEAFDLIFAETKSAETIEDLLKAHNSILSSTVFDFKDRAFPMSIRVYVVENYFTLVKSVVMNPLSAEETVLICAPIIDAVAQCDNKVFFAQMSESLMQGILPGSDEFEEEDEEFGSDEEMEDEDFEGEDEDLESEDEDESEDEELEDEDEMEDEDEIECDKEEAETDSENNVDSEEDEENSYQDSDCCEESIPSIFDYSKLGKYLFEVGGREEVIVRNRRFLFDFSKIIDEVNNPEVDCCGGEVCH